VDAVMAPIAPFINREVWQDLVSGRPGGAAVGAPGTRSLADESLIDPALSTQMGLVRPWSKLGRAARAESGMRCASRCRAPGLGQRLVLHHFSLLPKSRRSSTWARSRGRRILRDYHGQGQFPYRWAAAWARAAKLSGESRRGGGRAALRNPCVRRDGALLVEGAAGRAQRGRSADHRGRHRSGKSHPT